MKARKYDIPLLELTKYYIRDGLTMKEIAEIYSCSITCIRWRLKQYGLVESKAGTGKGGAECARNRLEGLTLEEVKAQLGLKQGSQFLIRQDQITEDTGKRKCLEVIKTVLVCYPYHVLTDDKECYTYGEIYANRCWKDGIGSGRKETA